MPADKTQPGTTPGSKKPAAKKSAAGPKTKNAPKPDVYYNSRDIELLTSYIVVGNVRNLERPQQKLNWSEPRPTETSIMDADGLPRLKQLAKAAKDIFKRPVMMGHPQRHQPFNFYYEKPIFEQTLKNVIKHVKNDKSKKTIHLPEQAGQVDLEQKIRNVETLKLAMNSFKQDQPQFERRPNNVGIAGSTEFEKDGITSVQRHYQIIDQGHLVVDDNQPNKVFCGSILYDHQMTGLTLFVQNMNSYVTDGLFDKHEQRQHDREERRRKRSEAKMENMKKNGKTVQTTETPVIDINTPTKLQSIATPG